MRKIFAAAAALLFVANSAWAYNEPSLPAGNSGDYQYNKNGVLAGMSASATQAAVYGLPNTRKKLASLKGSSQTLRSCFLGDSTTFGSYSNGSATGEHVAGSFPTQLANLANTTFGIAAESNNFLGAGWAAATSNHINDDARVVVGSSWTQDASLISFGGDAFVATTATNALSFTPTVPVDTFKIMYPTQPGNGVLSVQIDSGTAVTYSENSAAGISTATITTTLGTHSINFKWSSGGQVDVIGVYDAYDSSQPWLAVENLGWPGAKSTDYAVSTSPYNPGNPAAWAALGCDSVFIDLGINDWNNATGVSTYTTAMQTLLTAASTTTTDEGIITPFPTPFNNTSAAIQRGYLNAMYGLAATNKAYLFDAYSRWGSGPAAALLGLQAAASTIHPNGAGYLDEATALSQAIFAQPGQLNNQLAAPYTLNNGSAAALTLYGPGNQTGIGLLMATQGTGSGDTFGLYAGGNGYGTYEWSLDQTAGKQIWAASTTRYGLNSGQALNWTSSASLILNQAADTGISRISAGVVGVGTGAQGNVAGTLQAASLVSTGTKFTTSGCAVSATAGGAAAGTYTSGTSGTCTTIITPGVTSVNGWSCAASDRTTVADIITQTASTTTTATLAGPTNSGDIIGFFCMGY